MWPPLRSIEASNFRSLKSVRVDLGPLNVLVGANEAGKSNFLDLIEFLGDSARDDLAAALDKRGGFDRVLFRGETESRVIRIKVNACVTTNSSENALDEYELAIRNRRLRDRTLLLRDEEFKFKRTSGRGRRITVSGKKAEFIDTKDQKAERQSQLPLRGDSLALSTLRRLPADQGGKEVQQLADMFTGFRVFDVDADSARAPSVVGTASLNHNSSNLAQALQRLSQVEPASFSDMEADAKAMIPGLDAIEFVEGGSSAPTIRIQLRERGLSDPTYLEDASFGTIRLLALLTLLYDPAPPQLTCIEEIDHGLHPYLFDRLVERLREASTRTQLLVATHSPALVNRLRPDELIVAERAEDGSTRLPAASSDEIAAKVEAMEGRLSLGELWFSGSLGGVPR